MEATLEGDKDKEGQQSSLSSEDVESGTGSGKTEVLGVGSEMESVGDSKDSVDSGDVNDSKHENVEKMAEPKESCFDSFDAIAEAVGLIRTSSLKKAKKKCLISIPQIGGDDVNGTGPGNDRKALREFFENSNTPLTGGIGYELVKEFDNFTEEEVKACLAEQEKYCGTHPKN